MFHIYPIKHIDEGLELLLNYPAGIKDENGLYPENSIHGRAYKKLQEFAKAAQA